MKPGRIIPVNGNPVRLPREQFDPGVTGELTPVTAEDGTVVYIRENMDVREALALGQAALDRKDERISTEMRGGRRFPTYEPSPRIAREHANTMAGIKAEFEVALKHGKTADTTITRTGIEVTKPISQKYPVLYWTRRVWIFIRETVCTALYNLRNALRRI